MSGTRYCSRTDGSHEPWCGQWRGDAQGSFTFTDIDDARAVYDALHVAYVATEVGTPLAGRLVQLLLAAHDEVVRLRNAQGEQS